MKELKVIFLDYPELDTTSVSVIINCPFAVKHVHVKSISYQRNGANVSTAKYGVLMSDLTINQPLGVFFDDSTYSTTPNLDNSIEFKTPTFINGTYNFYMLNSLGKVKTAINRGDDIIVILEFDSGDV